MTELHPVRVCRVLFLILMGCVLSVGAVGQAAPKKAAAAAHVRSAGKGGQAEGETVPKGDGRLLPASFAGWEAAPGKPLTDAAAADAANAAALKEYGFGDGVLETYMRGGETLTVKALRFGDASGAYGAYSFYRQSNWPKEQVGSGATSDHNRVLFWQGNVLVDALFPHISAMSGSELRELAAGIPVPTGNRALYPPILGNLPQKNLEAESTHYALGPAGYAGAGGVLPPTMVGFDRGAEVATATYKLQSGLATLTVINYPTPQMATAQAKVIATYLKAGNTAQQPFTKPLQESNLTVLEVRRSGPLVAIVSGDPIQDEAHKLVGEVRFEADLSSSVAGSGDTDVQKTAKLLIAIITLVVVMFVAAVMLALFLGGGRALYRFSRGRPVSSVYDEEFIKLDLE